MPDRFKVTKSKDSGILLNKQYEAVDEESGSGDINIDQASEKLLLKSQDVCLQSNSGTGLF